jgi:thiol-disulfide isomerase/thioredoxin/outer membrane lipoprotein-sorting protein
MPRLNRPAVLIPILSVVFVAGMVAFSIAEDTPATTRETTAPATTAPDGAKEPELLATTKPAEVSAAAAPLLDQLGAAYKKLTSLELAGTLGGEFDVDGQKDNQKVEVTSSFAAPNKFRHALKDELIVGSTGEQLFIYESAPKVYKTVDTKPQRVRARDLPEPFGQILTSQSVSLALAMSSDPAAEIKSLYQKIDKAADVTIDGKAYPALAVSNPNESAVIAIDPQTNLLRRVTFDVANMVRKRGAQDVKTATLTMDYPTSKTDATVKPEQFAWAPPPGARDVAELQSGDVEFPSLALVGKPAPDFKLKDINDKDVSLAELKGNVLVFDFWATWCPPCVAAMPHLNELAGEMKDKGVKVVAINAADEEKELVQGFMNSRKLDNLVTLMDPASTVAKQYMATSPLPTTMVIGKDGMIRKVITTLGPEGERDLRAAIDEALNASK